MLSSIDTLRSFWSGGVSVWTTVPASLGVVQLAGVPRLPPSSTKEIRHEPDNGWHDHLAIIDARASV